MTLNDGEKHGRLTAAITCCYHQEVRFARYQMSMQVSGSASQPILSGNVEVTFPIAPVPLAVTSGQLPHDTDSADVSMTDEVTSQRLSMS